MVMETIPRSVARRLGFSREHATILYNHTLYSFPSTRLRLAALRALGLQAGDHTYLFSSTEVIAPSGISIAGRCHIGRYCQLDGRGGITIGWDVVIASHCLLVTADHDPQAPGFDGRLGSITIDDKVWIASRVLIQRNVHIGEGAVVAGGSVVAGDVEPYAIVGGVPARRIGDRSRRQDYRVDYGPAWY